MSQDLEPEVFDKDLEQNLTDTVDTFTRINRLGNAKAHETNLIRSMIQTLRENDEARYDLLVEMTRQPRRPLEPTRREQLEDGITSALPQMFDKVSRPQPPPVPQSAPRYSQTAEPHYPTYPQAPRNGAYSGPHN